MTRFMDPKFSVGGKPSKAYDEGWERTFGKKPTPEPLVQCSSCELLLKPAEVDESGRCAPCRGEIP